MALIDKASLLMVPSTYEAGKLYNVLPSGNRAPDNKGGAGYDQTRADFDFDRGSNAAATRIGSDGLLKKYQENLLLQSNQFDTNWNTNNSNVTSGHSGYDGTNNAWSIIATATTSARIIQPETNNGLQTISVYAKAGSTNFIVLEKAGSTGFYAWFNLGNGTIGTSVGEIDTTIESVGGGWYRCSLIGNTSGSQKTQFFIANADNSTAVSVNDFIYIQDAQLESGLIATDYLNSTSVTAKAGVLVDLPRINYDANGENGSLLLEPSRQQLIQFSEYFVSGWTRTNIGAITNAIISPQGVQNATKLTESGASNTNFRLRSSSTSTSGANTLSIFAKAGERNWVLLRENSQTGVFAYFNLQDGTIGQNTADNATIEPYGNGWYRISISDVLTSVAIDLRIAIADGDNDYDGVSGYGVYVYGAQIEQGSYPTSYIPNHGTSGGVTRAADSCSVTGASDVIGQTEGTMYAEAKIEGLKNSNTIVTLHNGSFSEYLVIAGNNSGNINAYIFAGGVQQAGIFSGTYAVDSVVKCAMAYKENDVAFYINGVLIGTDSSATMASTSVFDVGSISFGNYPLHGTIKQATLFKERLSNAELATLTTL